MKLKLRRGTTQKIVRLFIQDSSRTDGGGLVGLTPVSAGLVATYSPEGDTNAAVTTIGLVATTPGVWASGGFVARDATNWPGVYELGLPNAALATGASVNILLRGAVNMVTVALEIELDAVDYQDPVRHGATALPAVVLGNTGGLPVIDAAGLVQANLVGYSNAFLTAFAAALGGNLTFGPHAFDAVTVSGDVVSVADAKSSLPKMIRFLLDAIADAHTQSAAGQVQYLNDTGQVIATSTASDDGQTVTVTRAA